MRGEWDQNNDDVVCAQPLILFIFISKCELAYVHISKMNFLTLKQKIQNFSLQNINS